MTAGSKWCLLGFLFAMCLGWGVWGHSAHSEDLQPKILPPSVKDAIEKTAGVKVDYVVAVTPDGDILLAESDPDNPDEPGVLDLGKLPVKIYDSSEVMVGVGRIWFTGSDCHIEMQGGSPKLVPNTQKCRDKLRL